MKYSSIRYLLISGTIGITIPYIILTVIFDYPGILREDAGVILQRFKQGGSSLIVTWLMFAWLGFPLMIAYIKLGTVLQNRSSSSGWLTYIGVAGLLVQIVGLLRWTFVVPFIAEMYFAGDKATREVAKSMFALVNQFEGVLLGEHVGQLFTIIWVTGMSRVMYLHKAIPAWVSYLGYASSAFYLLAQGELLTGVIPGFPDWPLAGIVGSTLWLVWMILLAFHFRTTIASST